MTDPLIAGFGNQFQDLTNTDVMPDVFTSIEQTKPCALFRTAEGEEFIGWLLEASENGGVFVDVAGPAHEVDCGVRVELHDAVFVLRGHLRRRDDRWQLDGPLRIFSLSRRVTKRTALRPGRGELVWDVGGSDQERRSVVDLSVSGIGLRIEEGATPLPESAFPAELRIGSSTIRCVAEASRRAEAPGQTTGVRISPESMTSELIEVYLNERMPELVPRAAVDRDALFSLMRDSGYLDLRAPLADFEAWRKLDSTHFVTNNRVYKTADGRVIGHLAATRLYRKTWLAHQLACLQDQPEIADCRRLLYLFVAAIPTLYDGSDASLLAYFNLDLRWHDFTFKRFVKWMDDPTLALICIVDRFERDASAEPLQVAPAADVREIRSDELVAACALVREQIPAIVADAWDIRPEDLCFPAATREDRARKTFVLRERGHIVGVALCDSGDPNVSLFNLVNMAKIFVSTGANAPSNDGMRALVALARGFYEALDLRRPMIIAPRGVMNASFDPGTHLAEQMGCIVMTGAGLRHWENYCLFQFGLRWPRGKRSTRGTKP